jgi:hypothetical protein
VVNRARAQLFPTVDLISAIVSEQRPKAIRWNNNPGEEYAETGGDYRCGFRRATADDFERPADVIAGGCRASKIERSLIACSEVIHGS